MDELILSAASGYKSFLDRIDLELTLTCQGSSSDLKKAGCKSQIESTGHFRFDSSSPAGCHQNRSGHCLVRLVLLQVRFRL
jgi:hypothetical protein